MDRTSVSIEQSIPTPTGQSPPHWPRPQAQSDGFLRPSRTEEIKVAYSILHHALTTETVGLYRTRKQIRMQQRNGGNNLFYRATD